MRHRAISTAWLMFAARRLLAMSPPCAERMNVTTAPKSATANMTSRREKPRRMAQNPLSLRSDADSSSVGSSSSTGPPLTVTFPVSGLTSSVSVW